jgi:hypothetical protein
MVFSSKSSKRFALLCALSSLSISYCFAADADLAQKLANPVADIINLPFQLNYDQNIGASEDIERYQLNIQPVIPIKLNDQWNVISRTILPVVYQQYNDLPMSNDWGTGDLTQSFFFTPDPKMTGGVIVGFGPVLYLPTASEKTLGADQYGLGPTVVVAKQSQGWTYGALANHLWAVEKKHEATGINNTFLQPFLNYTTKNSVTWSLNTESTYDWNNDDYTIPVNLSVTKLLTLNQQPISIGGGVRYWAHDEDNSAKDFGVRLIASFVFPK